MRVGRRTCPARKGHKSNRMVLNEASLRLGVSLRQTEDQLMRDMLLATSTFINCVNGTDGDNPTEITRADCDYVVRTLRGQNAYSFLTGVEGENKFGTAPVRDALTKYAHLKSLVIDLELLTAA